MGADKVDNDIRKLLQLIDFSKGNPEHKENLRRALSENYRELSEDELDNVSAAGDPNQTKQTGKDDYGNRF